MSQAIIAAVEASQLKQDLPVYSVGDTVNVSVRIVENDKQRIQVFQGVILKTQGRGVTKTITVRRIVANEGVERTFPVHSPKIVDIEIVRYGDTRRAKLYFLRDRVGKKRRLRDRRRGLASLSAQQQEAVARASKAAAEAAPAEAAE